MTAENYEAESTHTESRLHCGFNSVLPQGWKMPFLMVLFSWLHDGVRLVQVKSGPHIVMGISCEGFKPVASDRKIYSLQEDPHLWFRVLQALESHVPACHALSACQVSIRSCHMFWAGHSVAEIHLWRCSITVPLQANFLFNTFISSFSVLWPLANPWSVVRIVLLFLCWGLTWIQSSVPAGNRSSPFLASAKRLKEYLLDSACTIRFLFLASRARQQNFKWPGSIKVTEI